MRSVDAQNNLLCSSSLDARTPTHAHYHGFATAAHIRFILLFFLPPPEGDGGNGYGAVAFSGRADYRARTGCCSNGKHNVAPALQIGSKLYYPSPFCRASLLSKGVSIHVTPLMLDPARAQWTSSVRQPDAVQSNHTNWLESERTDEQ